MLFSKKKNNGFVIASTLVFSVIAMVIVTGLIGWFSVLLKSVINVADREKAFHIAEAGVEYYRWHLAHSQGDYTDGTNGPGPYIHDYYDKDGNIIGKFEINVTPPISGSTVVVIESKGYLNAKPDIYRKVKVTLAIPSLAKYAFVTNSTVRFGEGTEVWGEIHANSGVRFDGIAHNIISSAVAQYDDPDHSGPNEYGVHTHVSPTDPLPPAEVPDRFDVFEAGRKFPVPAVDFNGFITDLSTLKSQAEDGGIYFPASGNLGYLIKLRTDDKFELYKITKLENAPNSCYNLLDQDGWGTWSVRQTNYLATYDFPSNGIMFFDDNIWVEGQIDIARLTIVAARFPDSPNNRRSITINNDLLYTHYDGSDTISLIAQEDINVGLYSDTELRIDAALIAVNGRAGRYYYNKPGNGNGCSPNQIKESLTLYGMIASKERYGFAYTDGTGYQARNIIYDPNLLFSPPPSFPLTSDYYEVVSWEEIK